MEKCNYYIFLDVDGVLNHNDSEGWQETSKVIDPVCFSCFKNLYFGLVKKGYKVEIILSSTWRLYKEHSEFLSYYFEKENIPVWSSVTSTRMSATRNDEINWSLNGLYCNNVVVIDDMVTDDFPDFVKIIHTCFENGGLKQEQVDEFLQSVEVAF